MDGIDVTYFGAFFAGLLSFLSPCVLPLVPPYLCFLGGVTLDEIVTKENANAGLDKRVFLSAVFFVLGFSTIFISLGATASTLGQIIADYIDVLAKIAGVIIIFLGVHFIGLLRIPLLYREARFQSDRRPTNLIGSYTIGLAFAFGWTPCVGPVLAAILFVAGSEASIFYGISLLTIYSIGLGAPFLLAAFAVKPFIKFMKKFLPYQNLIERVIGFSLIITGVLFLTGTFSELSYWLLEIAPGLGKVG